MSEFRKPRAERSDEANQALARVSEAIDDATDAAFRSLEQTGLDADLLGDAIQHYAGSDWRDEWRTWQES